LRRHDFSGKEMIYFGWSETHLKIERGAGFHTASSAASEDAPPKSEEAGRDARHHSPTLFIRHPAPR